MKPIKMKHLLTLIILSIFIFPKGITAQIHDVIVEKYYVSDSVDATDSSNFYYDATYLTPVLPIGSITYRVYVQLDSGYQIHKLYGTACHPLQVSSTANFYNFIDGGTNYFGYKIRRQFLSSRPLIALDSWFTLGMCAWQSTAVNYLGVPKSDDPNGSLIGGSLSGGYLTNADASAGIPVDTADGMVVATSNYTNNWVDAGFNDSGTPANGNDTTVFGNSNVGSQFYNTTAFLQENHGVCGNMATGNKILVGQFTTLGQLSFKLNIEVMDSTGGINNGHLLNFVADAGNCDSVGTDTTISGLLKFPRDIPVCGCGSPFFVEYNPDAPCFDSVLYCIHRIVYGCMDTLACNYDSNANFHIQSLCCYPGRCNDRDISLVCPGISNETGFTLFPNPAVDAVTLQISTTDNVDIKYTVYDSYGTIVTEKDLGVRPGIVSEQLAVTDYRVGLYLVRMYMGNTSVSKTFMKN